MRVITRIFKGLLRANIAPHMQNELQAHVGVRWITRSVQQRDGFTDISWYHNIFC